MLNKASRIIWKVRSVSDDNKQDRNIEAISKYPNSNSFSMKHNRYVSSLMALSIVIINVPMTFSSYIID